MRNIRRIFVLVLSCLLFLSGCYIDNAKAGNNGTVDNEKKQIIDMFMNYGTYDEAGYYKFQKFETEDYKEGERHLYTFSYYPIEDMFTIGLVVTAYDESSFNTVDLAGGNFKWENKEVPTFWAHHYIQHQQSGDILSRIVYAFSVKTINSDMSFGDYTYEVTENSFAQVSKNQMDIYAQQLAYYTKEAMIFAQSIVSAYSDGIILW